MIRVCALTFVIICLYSYVAPSSAGSALILTSLIKEKSLQAARSISLVKPSIFLNLTSYSGFLTVDEKYNSNTFFWYFPAIGRPLKEAPLIIWLQGGPGASSLVGVFDEIGPFKYDTTKGLQLREWSWARNHSMLFIDNPIGAGFSFTDSAEGFAKNMTMYTKHLYSALSQFTTLFPEAREAPLFISGESYAGRYVPALAVQIIRKADKIVNLKGVMLGNPVLNRESVANLTDVFYGWGLIDVQGALAVRPLQDAYSQAIRNRDNGAAYKYRDMLLDKLMDMTELHQTYNVLADGYNFQDFETFLQRPGVRDALHVGDIKFTFDNSTVKDHLIQDFLSEVSPEIEELLEEKCRVLIYCGQLDLTAPCVQNAAARRKNWQWSRRGDFLNASRMPWWYNESVAGYVKSGGGFTEVLVRGAGHLVPVEKPVQTYQLISYFIRDLDLPRPPNYVPSPADTPPLDGDKTGLLPSKNSSMLKLDITSSLQNKNSSLPNETISVPDKNSSISKTAISLPDKTSSTIATEGERAVSSVLVASVVINVILVILIAAVVVFYVRARRRNEMIMYNSVDNLSDDIFLS